MYRKIEEINYYAGTRKVSDLHVYGSLNLLEVSGKSAYRREGRVNFAYEFL